MKDSTRKLAFFSIGLNVLLIITALFFVQKRLKFQYAVEHPKKGHYYADNPQYLEQISLEAVYEKPGRIVMLGNSHVYKVQWDELLNRNDVMKRGIGSDITGGYLPRLKFILNGHPAICFIEGGVNDLSYHIQMDSSIAHLSALLDTLQYHHIIPVLHTVIYVARSYPDSEHFNSHIAQLNVKIDSLAKARKVDLIDLNPEVSKNEFLRPAYSQADGIHLTGEAYLIWKIEIGKILQKYRL